MAEALVVVLAASLAIAVITAAQRLTGLVGFSLLVLAMMAAILAGLRHNGL